jgi:lipopolysaccharide export system permease protein
VKVLDRYLAHEILGGTLLVFSALVVLFAFFDLINELPSLGKGNYGLPQIIAHVLLLTPGHVYELFPIAALIGSLYALGQLAHHSELTVMRASGFSIYRIALAGLRVGLLFVLLGFVVGEFIVPHSERMAAQLRTRAMNTVVAQEFRSGLWLKDGSSFVNVREVLPDSTLMGVRIYEFDPAYNLRTISYAAEGRHIRDSHWRLLEVEQTHFEGASVRVSHLREAHWTSVLNPDMLSVLLVVPEQMSAVNLFAYLRHLEENKQRTARYEIALWSKFVYPLAVLVMILLAVPFALYQPRLTGVGGRVFGGIMVGLFFHLLNRVFANLGLLQDWPPVLAAVLPTLFFLGLALAMMAWVERR